MLRPNGRRRRVKPRLPWKRGPVAWKIACKADGILERLEKCSRSFLSLRHAARILEISTQPLLDWTKRNYLKRRGQRLLYEKADLCRLVRLFSERAEPFDSENYLMRFHKCRNGWRYPFSKLSHAQFAWPKAIEALSPRAIAALAGCHPSSVLKAIKVGRVHARLRSACRFEITRRAWDSSFRLTLTCTIRNPPLPQGDPIPTGAVAAYLSACGIVNVDQRYVRFLVQEGKLEGSRPTPGKRKVF